MIRDPEVRRHLTVTRLSVLAPGLAARHDVREFTRRWARHGLGVWAIEADGVLVGWVGFGRRPGWSPLTDVEIGWLLGRPAWGRGYATEAATGALEHAFAHGIEHVIAVTSPANARSLALMERLGFERGEQRGDTVCATLSAARFRAPAARTPAVPAP